MNDIPWRIKYDKREDGYILSTIGSLDGLYGEYETAVCLEGNDSWNIAEGYNTKEEALIGHEKYLNMTTEEIENIEYIG